MKLIFQILLVVDLVAPLLAALFAFRLKRQSGWPAWRAYGVASSIYTIWAYATAATTGYSPSAYVLAKVGLTIAAVVGESLVSFDHPSEGNLLFFWYPFSALVVAPTLLLWGLHRRFSRRPALPPTSHSPHGVTR